MAATVLFNSLDRTLVSEDWFAATDLSGVGADACFVDCAGLPFCGDQVVIPPVVVAFARTVHQSTTLVVSLPMGPAGACGVFETAVAWLSRKEICHIMKGRRVIVQMGSDGPAPTEWPTELLRDLRWLGAVSEVRSASATPVVKDRVPQRLDDWVGRFEALRYARC